MVQHASPESTVDRAGWTGGSAGDDQNTSNIHNYARPFVTSTWITGDVGMDSAPVGPAIFTLDDTEDPEIHVDHKVKYSAFAIQGGFAGAPSLTIGLCNGSSSPFWSVTNSSLNTSQFTEYEVEMSTIYAAMISDYEDLRLQVTNNGTDMGDSVKIAWIYLEVPDKPGGSPFIIFVE